MPCKLKESRISFRLCLCVNSSNALKVSGSGLDMSWSQNALDRNKLVRALWSVQEGSFAQAGQLQRGVLFFSLRAELSVGDVGDPSVARMHFYCAKLCAKM